MMKPARLKKASKKMKNSEASTRVIRKTPQGDSSVETLVCPFLGMEDDSETSFLFPSPGNFCHRPKPAKSVSTGYQGAVCFDNKAFLHCPVYQKNWNGKLPEGFRQRIVKNGSQEQLTPRWVVLLLFLSLIFLAISAYFFLLSPII
ncbi:MAG: hypothetical protein KIT46_03535 [Anaerolineales bacterium]|nr:hypothetical protein [Anaerolineales bacterium]MCW5855098.1 hypothetical protein [Anaerolineales bacterium]